MEERNRETQFVQHVGVTSFMKRAWGEGRRKWCSVLPGVLAKPQEGGVFSTHHFLTSKLTAHLR